MKLAKKLSNPFTLTLGGFLVGAAIFSAIPADKTDAREIATPASSYQLPEA